MNGDGGCTGALHSSLPLQGAGAAAGTNSSNQLVMSSGGAATTREKRPPTAIDETTRDAKKQRRHHHLQVQVGGKRKFEEDSESFDGGCRENDKMFKCNYWEDPAYAKRLQRDGLQRARAAALDNQIERLLKQFDEPEVPNSADRYRRFDHDYW